MVNPRHKELNEAVKMSLNCDWKLPNRRFNYELAEFNYSWHHQKQAESEQVDLQA